MSIVWIYRVKGLIVGISAGLQNPINGIDWGEADADDPEIIQWMIDHGVIAPYGSDSPPENENS